MDLYEELKCWIWVLNADFEHNVRETEEQSAGVA